VIAASLIPAAYAQAQGNRAAFNPGRTPDGQPKIPAGIYGRRGVGGLDEGALEAEAARPQNPLDPTPRNPVSVSSRPDGLNNVDRGFLEQFTERVQAGRAIEDEDRPNANEPRERRLMGIAEPGRILPWKPEANAARQDFLLKTNPAKGIQYLEMDARCAQPGLFFGGGPYQFLQTPGQVVMLSEYQHYTRTIHLDGRPHLPKEIKLFMGDSVGRWEGNTLVVETTNFTGFTSYSREIPYLTDTHKTTERFTITDANTIDYEVTIDDPVQFTRPWKATGQFVKNDDQTELLEYACWEGSITVRNILGDPPARQ
jgi:hypothetical protein